MRNSKITPPPKPRPEPLSGPGEKIAMFDFRNDDAYKAAIDYAQNFEVCPERNYDWAIKHAMHEYERHSQASDVLDNKANELIKYVGSLSALSSIAGIIGATNIHWSIGLAAFPAFIFALFAIWFAVNVRKPMDQPTPPSAERAIAYIEDYGDQSETEFLPQWWAATEGMKAICNWKAEQFSKAENAFKWSLILLMLPLITAIFIA